jgi:hypothetical protein
LGFPTPAVSKIAQIATVQLTEWKRERAPGRRRKQLVGGFIDTYVEGVLYPQRYVAEARAVAAVVVLVSWVGFVRRRRRAEARAV